MAIPKGMSRKQWGDFVARGEVLARQFSQAAWEMGDLLADMIPQRPFGGRKRREYPETVEQIIIKFMEELSDCPFSLDALINFRMNALSWPKSERIAECSWAAHKELMGHRHLLSPGMTQLEARNARKSVHSPPTPTLSDIVMDPSAGEAEEEQADVQPIGMTADECLKAAIDWTKAATRRASEGQRIRASLLMLLNQEARKLDEVSYKEYEPQQEVVNG